MSSTERHKFRFKIVVLPGWAVLLSYLLNSDFSRQGASHVHVRTGLTPIWTMGVDRLAL
ncbi:MAG TPA: hypothetical protein V6D30_13875 [Leptolyngbyaceae cyanobacterium]